MGFRFLDLKPNDLKEIDPRESSFNFIESEKKLLRGTIHYKYMPRTGVWGLSTSHTWLVVYWESSALSAL